MFLDILTSRNSPEVVLRLMNEAGVLGRFVPEFGRIVAMMQFNMYHHYTVDEHLLRADRRAERHRGGTARQRSPARAQDRRHHPQPAGALRGDVSARHRQRTAGRSFARRAPPSRASSGRALGWTDAETETVAWLVEYHLLMSNTAQSRDLSDNATIKTFADVVQTMERLKLLLVLTIADIKAVGPGVWTGWKGQLLRNLYHETEIVLGGGAMDIARSERVRLAQEELRAELPDWTQRAIRRLCGAPFARLLAEDRRGTRRTKQARFVNEAEKAGRTVTTTYRDATSSAA